LDCNGNNEHDLDEIANCQDCDPSCADCNGNQCPDGSDIANGTSIDEKPENGIPDECEQCPGDLFLDGVVDAMDLAIVLGAWGACDVGPCPDQDGNCLIDAVDLAIVLGAWGPCP
jgi:hypothetical protein